VGLILDLAVVVLAAVVIGSLAVLAWTLAVSAVRASRRSRAGVADARRAIAEADARLRTAAARAGASLEELSRRTGADGSPAPAPGEREHSDA
jgi:hypothetical protein